jgi:hypothetical protein
LGTETVSEAVTLAGYPAGFSLTALWAQQRPQIADLYKPIADKQANKSERRSGSV